MSRLTSNLMYIQQSREIMKYEWDEGKQAAIRIISLRKANRREREFYETI